MKTCTKCKEEKNYSEFCKQTRAKDGHQPACKNCMNIAYNVSRNKKKEHYKNIQKSRVRLNRAKVNKWKHEHGCKICKENDASCLDLHHLDLSVKEDHPSDILARSINAFFEEAKKCVILCANCHRKLHAGKINLPFA